VLRVAGAEVEPANRSAVLLQRIRFAMSEALAVSACVRSQTGNMHHEGSLAGRFTPWSD
jgi:hypothetical protein